MFVKFIEIYMLPIQKESEPFQRYSLRETAINVNYIVEVKENVIMENLLKTNVKQFPVGMSDEQKITLLIMKDKKNIAVIGDINTILQKVSKNDNRVLLKG